MRTGGGMMRREKKRERKKILDINSGKHWEKRRPCFHGGYARANGVRSNKIPGMSGQSPENMALWCSLIPLASTTSSQEHSARKCSTLSSPGWVTGDRARWVSSRSLLLTAGSGDVEVERLHLVGVVRFLLLLDLLLLLAVPRATDLETPRSYLMFAPLTL